jgi:hypothetical protein
VQHGSDVASVVGGQHAKRPSLQEERDDYRNGKMKHENGRSEGNVKEKLESPLCIPPIRTWTDQPQWEFSMETHMLEMAPKTMGQHHGARTDPCW